MSNLLSLPVGQVSPLTVCEALANRPLTNSQGTLKNRYQQISEAKSNTVSAGRIPQQIELGDLGNSEFYDQVAKIRESIREYDTNLTQLQTKQLYSLQPHHDSTTLEGLSVEMSEINTLLALAGGELKKQIEDLGHQVGADEARRGHWENLKSGFKRAIERQQSLEMQQRERVRERVARQYRIGELRLAICRIPVSADIDAGVVASTFQSNLKRQTKK